MGQKVITNLGYRLHPETISPLFADLSSTTHCSAIVRFIQNNCICFVRYGWAAQVLIALATLPISVTW